MEETEKQLTDEVAAGPGPRSHWVPVIRLQGEPNIKEQSGEARRHLKRLLEEDK